MSRANSPSPVKEIGGSCLDAAVRGDTLGTMESPSFEHDTNNLLLVFIVLSCLAHIVLLVWLHPVFEASPGKSQAIGVLHVQVGSMPVKHVRQHRRFRRKLLTPHRRERRTPPKAGPVRDAVPKKKVAQIVEDAFKAAPLINQKLETEQPKPGHALIFAPRLRAQLEKARRKQTGYDALMRVLAQNREIKLVGKSKDFIVIRMHNQCWQVPTSQTDSPFASPRIARLVSPCPLQEFNQLGKHPKAGLP